MSLLDDFSTMVEKQDNSLELYFLKMVLKDQNPLVMSLEDYKKETNLDSSRVYIVSGFEHDPSSERDEFFMFLGTVEDGIRKITTDELTKYLKMLQEHYQEEDAVVENFLWNALLVSASHHFNLQYDCDAPSYGLNNGAIIHYAAIQSLCAADRYAKNSNFRICKPQLTSQEIMNNYTTIKIDYSK